ncbi:T9SS type A sorting domain-containing protein [Neolewinella aurantiaca]|nr:T9SS type A sorting domain-containing protein [Neolewinella aurantiaca]
MNLLTGNSDVDGDGIVPPQEAFIIEIDDNSPDNGPIVDGCGMFNYTIRPNPDSSVVGFTFGSGTITARDATPPQQFGTATPNIGPFFTPQLQELTINTLPASISRTFMVDGASGFPLMNSLSGELMNRLLAGGIIPRFTDACSDVTVVVSDEIINTGACEDIIIRRSFMATDASADCISPNPAGNNGTTTVTYDIVLERPNSANVIAPIDLVTYECNDPALAGGNFPDPDPEDYPFLNGPNGPVYLNEIYGNVGASFTNSGAVQICNNTIKYVRTYTVIDWCDTDNVQTFTQLVKVGDTGAPTIVAPTQDLDFDLLPDDGPLVFSTNAPGCGAYLTTNMAGLSITDGCSALMTVTAFVLINGDEDNISGAINVYASSATDRLTPFLPAGPHIIRYVAEDECGNQTTSDLDIVVEDRSGPVMIVEDALNVALSSSGFATVNATDLDEGSYDDCTDITLEIAFANINSLMPIGAYGPSITLSCVDLDQVVTGIPVIIRGTDENGNTNTRMSVLNVVDNTAPICIAPGNLNLTCSEADAMLPEDVNAVYNTDPEGTVQMFDQLFGEVTTLDNCGNEYSAQNIVANINDCGTGTINRSFTVTDGQGFVSAPGCEQIISIRGVRNYTVEFPGDASATCGLMPDVNDFVYTPLGCDMVVSYVEVDTFFAASDACFKIRRTIEIINWCEYDGNGDFYTIRRDADNDGNYEESTFLHVIPNGNTDAGDDVAVLDQDSDRDNLNNIGFLDVDDNFGAFGTDSDNDGDTGYADSESRGAFRYVQFIKVYDNIAPTITNISSDVANSEDCNGGGIQIDYTITDDCVGANLSTNVELDLNFVAGGGFSATRELTSDEVIGDGNGNYNVILSGLPVGEHAIRVAATDGCGNVNGRIIQFDIQDNSTVTPICIGRLTFVLMNDGAGGGSALVEADDFVVSLNGNCNNVDVDYSIYRDFEYNDPNFVPGTNRTDFPVSCDDVGDILVQVYAFTPNGQAGLCNATAVIEPSSTVSCTAANVASLSGFITSPRNELLDGIEVHISDMDTMDDMLYTDANGSFLFPALSEGHEYMIRPSMPDEVNLERIKTSDITIIGAHALGAILIEDPYRMIAADANGDGFIDIGDMIAIRRVILGIDATFTEGPTWRFIRRDFDLEGLTEGWDPDVFPTTYRVEELLGHNREADFVAIEIGDVFVQSTGRESQPLTASDATLAVGERIDLDITARDLAGFQGTFDAASGLEIEGWSSEVLSAGNVNDRYLSHGLLAVSYNGDELEDNAPVLTLHLRAAAPDVRISDYLSVTDRMTYPEAILTGGNTATLSLEFSETTAGGADVILHQNFPNPVAAQTNIVFELPRASDVKLEVHDLQGRIVTKRSLEGQAGRNTITLSTFDDLNNYTGVLTYTITVGQTRLTKRMTVVAAR